MFKYNIKQLLTVVITWVLLILAWRTEEVVFPILLFILVATLEYKTNK